MPQFNSNADTFMHNIFQLLLPEAETDYKDNNPWETDSNLRPMLL
jgi:hypothetical protein